MHDPKYGKANIIINFSKWYEWYFDSSQRYGKENYNNMVSLFNAGLICNIAYKFGHDIWLNLFLRHLYPIDF